MNVLILLTPFLLFAPLARANFSNYNSILIGDQAAGMGGAATAMTEDASALPWYNPAGLAKLKGQSFSSAVGIYKKFDTRFNDAGDLTTASLRVNQGFFRALPSSTGSVIRPKEGIFQNWTLALSILVPEYENFKGDIATQGESTSTLNITTESIWTGGAISRMISDRDSIGFTVYYTARSVSKSVYDRTYLTPTSSTIETEERNITQNGLVAQMGWHRDLDENWKLGLTYRLRSLSVASKAEIDRTTITNGTITPMHQNDMASRARIPWRTGIGLAYIRPGLDKWAFDIMTYGDNSYSDVENSDLAERIEHKMISNFSLGYERSWTEGFKTRTGIFSNFSSHPDPDPEKVRGQGDHVDQAGFSANMAFHSGNIEYTFGGYYTGGRGRSVQRIQGVNEVVTKVQNVFTMLVGTSYFF